MCTCSLKYRCKGSSILSVVDLRKVGHFNGASQISGATFLRKREGKHAEAQATQEQNLIEHVCKPKKQRLDAIGMACANQEDPALQKPPCKASETETLRFHMKESVRKTG